MQVKREVDIVLMIVFIILFFSIGSYIGIKDQNGDKIMITETESVWSIPEGAEEIPVYEEPKKVIEEMPAQIKNIEAAVIEIRDTKFEPSELNVAVGTTVTWINQDPKRNYQVYEKSTKQIFNARLKPYDSFNFTFDEPGVYLYNDAIFSFMNGVITVG